MVTWSYSFGPVVASYVTSQSHGRGGCSPQPWQEIRGCVQCPHQEYTPSGQKSIPQSPPPKELLWLEAGAVSTASFAPDSFQLLCCLYPTSKQIYIFPFIVFLFSIFISLCLSQVNFSYICLVFKRSPVFPFVRIKKKLSFMCLILGTLSVPEVLICGQGHGKITKPKAIQV